MASLKFPLENLAVFVIISVILLPIAHAQSSSPAPAPTSDGINLRTNLWLIRKIYRRNPILENKKLILILFWFDFFGRNIDRSGDSVCSDVGGFGVDLFHSLTWWIRSFCSSSTMVLFLPSVLCYNSFFLVCDVRFVENQIRFWSSCFVLFLLVGLFV